MAVGFFHYLSIVALILLCDDKETMTTGNPQVGSGFFLMSSAYSWQLQSFFWCVEYNFSPCQSNREGDASITAVIVVNQDRESFQF